MSESLKTSSLPPSGGIQDLTDEFSTWGANLLFGHSPPPPKKLHDQIEKKIDRGGGGRAPLMLRWINQWI